ncbi:MAG: DUF3098 domain-containing protein [Bacteroidetes bacterium]|nr:DUF3098 domain-containing protein [Bacteroidota bacterium]MBU1373788.1 DUF3098 domain-containing protein [Bacteroidota bacterium]MBU1483835.1 DUF3098 domain-containing protein [Bacteroidota bacterium]MBU1760267.1 DUF3098 domain-containing protein [Bacteroidota bacterium]MBU2046480.1 DUF3098 domain-containing protein [Bacteroidota bacterium]
MAKKQSNINENSQVQFVFKKQNYQILIASIVIVIIGFILMSGTTDIYSFRKIVLAPIVVLSGFALGFFAILKKPSTK